jgi:ubiquinone/menaquinone biosynthesis C-methylase UbiE
MDQKLAKEISQKVQLDYNRIAKEFSNKRRGLTPDILEFGKFIKKGDKVLDFGCGNGRASELAAKIGAGYTGVDNSTGLINQAKKRYPRVRFDLIDNLNDFSDDSFDMILCLAVFHHIPSDNLRKKLLSDFHRVLRPDGKLILAVWDLQSQKNLHKTMPNADENDILYDFKNANGKILVQRYIHIFSKEELEDFVLAAGFEIIDSYRNSRGNKKVNHNLVVIAKK